MLVKAGAELEVLTERGASPLQLVADLGHSEIMAALIEAGADPNRRNPDGETPLYTAAHSGRIGAVKVLLRAGADPMLARGGGPSGPTPEQSRPSCSAPTPGMTFVPLDTAAEHGRSEVVRELIWYCGRVEGCGGCSGGAFALQLAAQRKHVDIVAALTGAGAMDTGAALVAAAGAGLEASVKALLQQRLAREPDGVGAYVDNARGPSGATAVHLAIGIAGNRNRRELLSQDLADAHRRWCRHYLLRSHQEQLGGRGSVRLPHETRDRQRGEPKAGREASHRGRPEPAGGSPALAAEGGRGSCNLLALGQARRLHRQRCPRSCYSAGGGGEFDDCIAAYGGAASPEAKGCKAWSSALRALVQAFVKAYF